MVDRDIPIIKGFSSRNFINIDIINTITSGEAANARFGQVTSGACLGSSPSSSSYHGRSPETAKAHRG
eukprot:TRINITY_DN5086_c0_g1_i1.p3 TRINITY_DN5086_c0_g1~~TRINITY_DN5086_c0_g1_i1.p3  ORF type:complete len:68 (+),score=14.34 TRINITY_DN5086_c0_g1_i1:281-484(+)